MTPTTPTSQPENPVTPAQPAASETKEVASVKPVAVTYHTGGQAEVAATPATVFQKQVKKNWLPQSLASLA